MIQLIFHTPPTNSSMREAMDDVSVLIENVDKPRRDIENDNFYFELEADRETCTELKQILEKKGYVISVKDQGVYMI